MITLKLNGGGEVDVRVCCALAENISRPFRRIVCAKFCQFRKVQKSGGMFPISANLNGVAGLPKLQLDLILPPLRTKRRNLS